MPIHIDMAMFVSLHPDDMTYFKPRVGLAIDIPFGGLDFGECGFHFQICFRVDASEMGHPATSKIVLRDPDGKIIATSPMAKPLLMTSPYDGVGHGWILHPLTGFKAREHGRQTMQIFINDSLVKETTISVERPSRESR